MVQFMTPSGGGGGVMMAARPEDKAGELVTRFDGDHFGDGAQVVIGEREGALFMANGAVLGILTAGRHTLTVDSVPFLQSAPRDPAGGFRMMLLFVGRMVRGVRFGGKVNGLRDRQGAQADLSVFGEYGLWVTDPSKLITQLTGPDGNGKAATDWTSQQLMQHIKGCLSEWFNGGYFSFEDMSRVTKPLVEAVSQHCANFEEYGLRLQQISSINIRTA